MQMRIVLSVGFLALFLVLSVFTARVDAAAAVIHVPYDYLTIQEAVDAAGVGDTIIVHPGTYNEHVVVTKELVLVGEEQMAIIDGGGVGTVLNITSSGVSVSGFTISNAGGNWTQRDSGIYVRNRQFCTLEANHIENSRLGIYLTGASHITIAGNVVTNNVEGIRLEGSPENTIAFNSMVGNDYNLVLSSSEFNGVKGNHIADAPYSGVHIQYLSANNTLYGNTVANCGTGVVLSQSDSNLFYHNNFIENVDQAWFGSSAGNVWDIGWPDGGNYWSDHSNVDVQSGQYQMGPGSDGICDSAYTVEAGNLDKYPCAGPANYFAVEFIIPEDIVVLSTSAISDFQMNTTSKTISFFATGDPGTAFARVDIPSSIASGLWMGNYQVLVNDIPIGFGNWTAGSTTYIYFKYTHSAEEIVIVPEFHAFLVLPLFAVATFAIAIAYKRKNTSI
jgi:parallel beta-helix repeat protein